MDHTQRERLSALVEELTTSGEPQLNPTKMKDVKKICKASNDYIDHFYHLIMRQLAQEHAEIRFSALQMVNELFSRSHHFRMLLVSNFQGFLELTVETDPEQPLPPPREVARKLKILAIRTVQEWQASYGEAYKKLALGYHFLKQIKKVDFHDVQARTQAERKRQEEKQKRLERLYKDKVDKATKEMEESSQEIQESLTEMHSCLKLLAPHPMEFNLGDLEPAVAPQTEESTGPEHRGKMMASTVDEEQPCCSKDLGSIRDEDEAEEQSSEEDSDMEELPEKDAFIRHTGLMSHKYSLDLDLSADLKVKESEENEAVVNTVRDLHRLVNTKHLPAVRSWVQVFTKAGVDQQLLRQAVNLRTSLEEALRRHDELHIQYRERERRVMKAAAEGEEDEDEDDFEEVPEKEGFEPHIPDHLRAEYGLEPLASSSSSSSPLAKPVPAPGPAPPQKSKRRSSEEEQDPTCAAATLRVLRERFPSARLASGCHGNGRETPSAERGKAPVVPFGLDLYYWGEEQPTAGKIIKNTSQHQFWVPHEVEEEAENEELSAQAKSRFITFSGSFQPVKHKCGAPMSNGSLCERQDRVKCPFHGPIIPRDELGRPRNPEDAARLEQERMRREEEQPDWRDPELMRDIEAATGEDLGSSKTFGKGRKGSKGKGKKRKYPNLTDLKQNANTSRSRLERKVFNNYSPKKCATSSKEERILQQKKHYGSSMRRVTDAMNRLDKRKHEKFANQFNYALN